MILNTVLLIKDSDAGGTAGVAAKNRLFNALNAIMIARDIMKVLARNFAFNVPRSAPDVWRRSVPTPEVPLWTFRKGSS